MIINLPDTISLPNGYNVAVMNYSPSQGVQLVSPHVQIDGMNEKSCPPGISFKMIAATGSDNEWVSIGSGNTNIDEFIINTNTPNTTVNVTVNHSNDNDVFIFPKSNYYTIDKHDSYNFITPGYLVKIDESNLYPGFRFSLLNYSESVGYLGDTPYNINLEITSGPSTYLNNKLNNSIMIGPWWVYCSGDGTKGGYSNAPCATFMYDGAGWWNV